LNYPREWRTNTRKKEFKEERNGKRKRTFQCIDLLSLYILFRRIFFSLKQKKTYRRRQMCEKRERENIVGQRCF